MSLQRSRSALRSHVVRSGLRKPARARANVLVIGGGVAGLRAAIAASEYGRVVVITGSRRVHANTRLSQGGIAVPVGDGDGPDLHLADTLAAGDGLCDERAARFIIERGEARLGELLEWGLAIDRYANGSPSLGLEGGHRARRIVRARDEPIGLGLYGVLMSRAQRLDDVLLLGGWSALDLLTTRGADGGRGAAGVVVHHPSVGVRIIRANATILATGGASGLYARSTNSPHATGDGIAMAHRAGVALGGMEFVQFHPTALDVPEYPRPLISEAVRGEGALLVDSRGRRLMAHVHPQAELAPRDIVSRTMALLLLTPGTQCFLDARSVRDFKSRFPAIATELHRRGMAPSLHAIPVTPAAHYLVGGIATDLCGRTSLPGLYAAGEVASTGMHGANRLASNSLLEGLVMGEIAGRHAGQHSSTFAAHYPVHRTACSEVCSDLCGRDAPHKVPIAATLARSLRRLMWAHVGVLRDARGLRQAAGRLDVWQELLRGPQWFGSWKLRNMVDVAAIITRAALARDESAGCHYRIDGPLTTRGLDRAQPPTLASTTRNSHA